MSVVQRHQSPAPRRTLYRVHRGTERDTVEIHDVLRQGGSLVGNAEGLLVLVGPTSGRTVAVIAAGLVAQVAAYGGGWLQPPPEGQA